MGEWSEYFEDFPKRTPGNYDKNGRFNPQGVPQPSERQNPSSGRIRQT